MLGTVDEATLMKMKTALEGWLLSCLVCSVCTILDPPCGGEGTGRDEQEEPTLLHTCYVLHRYYYSLLPT